MLAGVGEALASQFITEDITHIRLPVPYPTTHDDMWGDWDHVNLDEIEYSYYKPKTKEEDPAYEGFLGASVDQSVLVFDQTDDLGIFLCDYSQTHGDPAFPSKAITEYFYIAGFFQVKSSIQHVRFIAEVNDDMQRVYNVPYPSRAVNKFGQWISKGFAFIIPGAAPNWHYYIYAQGETKEDGLLFNVTTDFEFN